MKNVLLILIVTLIDILFIGLVAIAVLAVELGFAINFSTHIIECANGDVMLIINDLSVIFMTMLLVSMTMTVVAYLKLNSKLSDIHKQIKERNYL